MEGLIFLLNQTGLALAAAQQENTSLRQRVAELESAVVVPAKQ